MAIARLIAPFSQLSGKVPAPNQPAATSASVAMPDANGRTLMRSFVVPANPDTNPQQIQRAIFTSVAEAMNSLTPAQKQSWVDAAVNIQRIGRLQVPFNFNWTMLFVQVNNYRVLNDQTIATTAPSIGGANIPSTINSITVDGTNVTFALSEPGTPTSGSFVVVRATPSVQSTTRLARNNELRFLTDDPSDSIIARITSAPFNYTVDMERFLLEENWYSGVQILVLNSGYVPVGQLFNRSLLVNAI